MITDLEAVVIDEIEEVAVTKEFVHQHTPVVVKEAAFHIHHRTSLLQQQQQKKHYKFKR